MEKIEIINEINRIFKDNKNKWSFLNKGNMNLKIYIGQKECDIQILKFNNLHFGGLNYQNKTKTKDYLINYIEANYKE